MKLTEEERANKRREYKRKYYVANRDKILAANKEYRNRPEVKQKMKEYYSRPDVKLAKKEYDKSKKRKEYKYEYVRRPEVKRNRALYMRLRRKTSQKQRDTDKKCRSYSHRSEKYKIYVKRRMKTDINYVISKRCRDMLRYSFSKYIKNGLLVEPKKYNINYSEIIQHLLKNKPKGVSTLDLLNGKKWHIDHIKPISSFNLLNELEFKMAFAPENHQFLPAIENLKKSNKILNSEIFKNQ